MPYDEKTEKFRRLKKGEKCRCARCLNLPTANKKYGYDESKVKFVHCLKCDKPIGDEPYVEITLAARFGQMTFGHKRCFPNEKD